MIGRGCWVLLGLNQLLQCTKNLLVIALVANRLLWLPVVVADASLLLSKLSLKLEKVQHKQEMEDVCL